LFELLEEKVIPAFYGQTDKWVSFMKASIKTGVRFTAQRMIRDYKKKYY
jgi:glucan phosphorylase